MLVRLVTQLISDIWELETLPLMLKPTVVVGVGVGVGFGVGDGDEPLVGGGEAVGVGEGVGVGWGVARGFAVGLGPEERVSPPMAYMLPSSDPT